MFHKNIINEFEKKNKKIIDEFENDDDNQDLHRWWFESRCSNKKMTVTARSWEEVVKDPRFKPWKFSFIFVVFVVKYETGKTAFVLLYFWSDKSSIRYWKY